MRFTTSAVVTILSSAAAVSALNQLKIQGRHFYDSVTGNPFFVRGLDYQPGGSSGFQHGSDPLTDIEGLARDIFLFQKLGINAIRVYSVDPTVNHDQAMTMLNAAGIYVFLDVNTPIDQEHLVDMEPWTSYTPGYLNHIFTVLEVFENYDNLAGILAGNEVVFQPNTGKWAPQYIKATIRDIRNYMKKNMKRQLLIGYANADKLDYRVSMAEYLQCGPEGYVDWFGVNSYQWCGPTATFETSGYDILVNTFQNYSLPLVFTEFGCNQPAPRVFNEVQAMNSDEMTGVFSGGLVYQYNEDTNNYGLATVSKTDNSTTTNGDFDALASQYAKAPTPSIPSNSTNNARPTVCAGSFPNINATNSLPATLGQTAIDNGAPGKGTSWQKGKFVDMSTITTKTTYKIFGTDGKQITDNGFNASVTVPAGVVGGSNSGSSGSGSGNGTHKSAAIKTAVGFSSLWTVALVGAAVAAFI